MPLSRKPSQSGKRSASQGLFSVEFVSAYDVLLKTASITATQKEWWKQAFDELDDFYHHAPCGFHALDQAGMFIRINDTALQWLGYSREELVGRRSFRDLLTPKGKELFDVQFPLFLETGQVHELEFELVKKDGSPLPVLLSSTAVYDEEKHFIMSRSVMLNISLRKEAEWQLIQQQAESEKLNKELFQLRHDKEQFIGIFVHNLQHPLASIALLSEVLMGEEPENTGTRRDIIKLMHEASMQMQELVRNYLSVERIENGSIPVDRKVIDAAAIARDVVRRYRLVASNKKIDIRFHDPGPMMAFTDRDLYRQILENLLSNAVKYSPENREVDIRMALVNQELQVSVSDQGPGIPPEEIPLLFQRFRSLSIKPTGGEHSTGLGLSIVQYLCHLLDGDISVASTVGQGSEFRFHIAAG